MTLRDKLARAQASPSPAGFSEMRRILGLPIIKPLSPAELEAVSRAEVQAKHFDRGFRLWPAQAEAILSFDAEGGLFGNIGCGRGKTIVSLIAAEHHARQVTLAGGVPRVLLLVPKSAVNQLTQRDIPRARELLGFSLDPRVLAGREREDRAKIAKSKWRGLYIMPYSLLSVPDTDEMLDAIVPDQDGLVIADEAHNLKNRQGGARTKRVIHMLEKKSPKFIALSGTITSKSIRDYHHLIRFALRQKCPLPLSASMAAEWSVVLDASAISEPSLEDRRMVAPLVDWAKTNISNGRISPVSLDGGAVGYDLAGMRRAYRARLVTAPGVTSTSDAEIGVSLVMSNRPVLPNAGGISGVLATAAALSGDSGDGWPEIVRLMKRVSLDEKKGGMGLTPNGDEIAHAIHTYKWLSELTSGFFNELVWPTVPDIMARRGLSLLVAQEQLAAAQIYHQTEQVYTKELRNFLKNDHVPGLDTPFLVGAELARAGGPGGPGRLPQKLYDKWVVMKIHEATSWPQGHIERDSKAVRVCPYKVNAAAAWALTEVPEGEGALIWCHHREIQKWVFEVVSSLLGSKRVLACPAGPKYDALIAAPETATKIVVASIEGHGEAKNLQAFKHQYVVQWPRGAHDAEQLLARTHRPGQQADELTVTTNLSTNFDHQVFAACLNDSVYIHTSNLPQRLIYASYDPLPEIYSDEFLQENGFQNKILTPEQKRILGETFAGKTN